MDQRIDTGAVLPGFRSFPLDRARRFAGDVQHHPVRSLHLIDDAVRDRFRKNHGKASQSDSAEVAEKRQETSRQIIPKTINYYRKNIKS